MSRAPLCDQTRKRSLHWSAHPGAAAPYQAATAHPPSLWGLWRRDEKWSVVCINRSCWDMGFASMDDLIYFAS